ncbi:MAG: response regulator [Acidobacteriota bacterium]|nr:response regulator [Acidobacteriota bacterium]
MSVHILIVDDEDEIRGMLDRHFTLLDYDVETAGNGKEAIDVIRRKRIDIVITDLMMPEMNGIELLEFIHEDSPMIHTIAITGYVTLENALSCMRLGADTIIFKPLEDLTELETAVRTVEDKMKIWQRKLRELRGLKPT